MNLVGLRSKQGGMVAMDMFMVLGIILALLLISVMVYTMSSSRVNSIQSSQGLSSMTDGIRNIFGRTGAFTGINNATVVAAGVVPKNMNPGTGEAITSQWNTKITVQVSSLGGTDDAFDIIVPGVPKSECATFVSGSEAMFSRVTVGGTSVKDLTEGVTFNPAATATSCGADGGVEVVFTAGKASGG